MLFGQRVLLYQRRASDALGTLTGAVKGLNLTARMQSTALQCVGSERDFKHGKLTAKC